MPKFKITIDFDGEEAEYEIERDTAEEAEWYASDRLRDMVNDRTSYAVEALPG